MSALPTPRTSETMYLAAVLDELKQITQMLQSMQPQPDTDSGEVELKEPAPKKRGRPRKGN